MLKGIRFFISEGWKYDKRYVLWLIFDALLSSLTPIAAALAPRFIIDELMGAQRPEYLAMYVAVFAGYALLAGTLSSYFAKDGFTRRCRVGMEFDMRMDRQLIETDYPNMESPDFMDMKEKAQKFLYCDWHGFGYLMDCAVRIIGQAATLIGLAAILSTLNVCFVALFACLAWVSAWIEGRAKKDALALSMDIARDQRGMMYFNRLFDDPGFGRELRLNGAGAWALEKFGGFYARVNACQKKQNNLFIRSGAIRAALSFGQQAAAYAFLIVKVLNRAMTIGEFTMCVTSVVSFAEALRQIMDSVSEIRAYDMYYDRLDEYLNLPRRMRQGARPIGSGSHTLVFENVSFRYPGAENWALRHVNLTLRPGKRLALVGENGSGKTTLIKLLCRMYDPIEGVIRLDVVDIRDMDYEAYMGLFAAVFQDYRLFDLPLRDNITMGRAADDRRVAELCRRVGLGERLDSLPNGLDTYVGREFDPQGFLPSGGEGQKIALARALFRDAPVIVLDEPAAALDPRAEYELYRAFDALIGSKTAVYISHRLSSSRFCDAIAVLDGGELVEYGAHEQLIALNGRYAALYSMQAQYYAD